MACSESPLCFSILYPSNSGYLRGCPVRLVSFTPCILPCSQKLAGSGSHVVRWCELDLFPLVCVEIEQREKHHQLLSAGMLLCVFDLGVVF